MVVLFLDYHSHSPYSSFGVLLGPESGEFIATVVGYHGGFAGLPAGWADLAVLIDVLEGLNKTDGLVNITANGKIVDGDLAEGTIRSDDEGASKGNTCIITILDKDTVIS